MIEASASSPSQRSSGNSDSIRGCAAPSSSTSIDRRHANSCVSLISPRYSTCRCTTRPRAVRVFSTTLTVAVLLAILPANLAAQEHDGRRLSAHWPAPALTGQSLALRKLCDAGSNRRSQARARAGDYELRILRIKRVLVEAPRARESSFPRQPCGKIDIGGTQQRRTKSA